MVRVAASYVDITPGHPTQLGGFADRREPAQGVADTLEANAIVFLDDEHPSAIVSVDLLYPGEIATGVQSELADLIDPERLLIVASHTHFAPATDTSMPKLGLVDAEYVGESVRKIAGLIRTLLADSDVAMPTMISYRRHVLSGAAVSRRRPSWLPGPVARRLGAQVVFAPNLRRPIDEQQHVIWFGLEGGNLPTAMLWSYGCHPVSFPDSNRVSADYPGWVRRRLREKWGARLPVLFLQGCSSDSRPLFTRRLSNKPRDLLKQILSPGPVFRIPTMVEWQEWSDRFLAAMPTDAPPRLEQVYRIGCHHSHLDAADDTGLAVQTFELGDVVRLVAFNAELSPEAGRMVADALGAGVIPVSCMGRVIGYWPTTESLREGGYEAIRSRDFFSARVAPNDPDKALADLLKQVSSTI